MAPGSATLLRRAASRYSVRSRRRKAAWLRDFIAQHGVDSALLVGVEDAAFPWSNIVERAIVDAVPWTVATGLGPKLDMGSCGLLCDGRRLPFRADSFDLVISNAVIEHVGTEKDQARFVEEHHRVGRRFVITTPNLLFPVESHTRVVGLHWSRTWRTRHRLEFSRLLTPRAFRRLLPAQGTTFIGRTWSPTLIAVHECPPDCDVRPAAKAAEVGAGRPPGPPARA